jgi:hypothetical protein
MTDRKKPGVAFWATVMVASLAALYVLSFGPACWIASRTRTDDAAFFSIAYRPMWWAMHRQVPFVSQSLSLYAGMGLKKGGYLQVPSAGADDLGAPWSQVVILTAD